MGRKESNQTNKSKLQALQTLQQWGWRLFQSSDYMWWDLDTLFRAWKYATELNLQTVSLRRFF